MTVYICTSCESVANPRIAGSGGIELVLWLCAIIPGLIYSIWRRQRIANLCPVCGANAMVPVTSKRGREVIAQDTGLQGAVAQRVAESQRLDASDLSIRKACFAVMLLIIAWGIGSWIYMAWF